ncbi:MAG: cytidine deaminase [Lachnospiraceae bacterium]|nr:cytidine deaminase [Lachnospiraceae bacterium]
MAGKIADDVIEILISTAHDMQQKSYAPYSGFSVGAALLTKDGKIYRGCNIENAAYSPSNCAERTAFFKAVSEGEREFKAIAIVGGKDREIGELCFPCGVCRQVMAEFCEPDDFLIITRDSAGTTVQRSLRELLPDSFTL